MVRLRGFVALASLALFAGGCTAFVAAELSNEQSNGPALGSCFNLANNQCGACIATQCERPNDSPPVSLAKLCDLGSSINYSVQDCAQDPTVNGFGDNCSQFFVDGGTYAPAIDTQATAENNLELCIRDQCETSCRTCSASVKVCGSDTTPLEDAGACGACLYGAMSDPGSTCQSLLIKDEYACQDLQSDLGACATPSGSSTCVTADCSALADGGTPLAACLWNTCASSCPN